VQILKPALTAAILIVLISACTWVKVTPEGEKVRVAKVEDVANCEREGEVKVSLKSRVGAFERKPGKVLTELETLARNEAVSLGGDTVVGESPVQDGTKKFGVYRCLR